MYRLFLAIGLSLCVGGSLQAEAPKKLLLMGQGPDGHPPQTHEYNAGVGIVARLLKDVPGIETNVVRADEPWREGPELIQRSDGVVIFLSEGGKWMHQDPKRLEALQQMAARGGGIVVLHWGMGTKDAKNIDGCLKLLGGCHGGPDRKYKVVETEARIADPKHPIATGLGHFKVKDEFYYQLKLARPEGAVQPIIQVTIDDKLETVAWAWERPDKGRSFGFSGLHFHDNWRLPEYRRLVAQGVLWSLKLPIPKDGLKVEIAEEELKVK